MDAKAMLKLAAERGPEALRVAKQVQTFIKENPELAGPAMKMLDRLLRQTATSSSSSASPSEPNRPRGAAGKVDGTISAVRREAERLRAESPGDEHAATTSDEWVRRADNIERLLGLADARDGVERRKLQKEAAWRADALFAEVVAATVEDATGAELDDGDGYADRSTGPWTLEELQARADRWQAVLIGNGATDDDVATYVGSTRAFLTWLGGEADRHR